MKLVDVGQIPTRDGVPISPTRRMAMSGPPATSVTIPFH